MRLKFCVMVIAILGVGVWAHASLVDVNLLQDRYLGEVVNSTQSENYTSLGLDIKLDAQTSGFKFAFNPVVNGALGVPGEFYFGGPEMYIQPRNLAQGFALTIGRQKRTWSHLDEEFNLGVWQPQLRWDYLAPKQEGLIGIFFDWSVSSNVRFTFFTSPLFLPDQGPNFQLTDGQFTSNNRWFEAPQRRLDIFNGTAPLNYSLDRPTNESVVMNTSFALGVLLQEPGSPYWFQANYAYKPMNQIHLGVECAKCGYLGGPDSLDVTAIVHPAVIKHNVLTMETGFERVDDRGYVSLTGDYPNASSFPSDYIESPLDSMIVAGGAYEHYLYSWLGLPVWLKGSYMKTFDVRSKDKQSLVDADSERSSLDRYPYREVAAVEWTLLLSQKSKNKTQWRTRYSYSVPEKGGWLSSALALNDGPVTWSVGLDFLGSDTAQDSPNAGLFTRYQANNRVFGGVSYVF